MKSSSQIIASPKSGTISEATSVRVSYISLYVGKSLIARAIKVSVYCIRQVVFEFPTQQRSSSTNKCTTRRVSHLYHLILEEAISPQNKITSMTLISSFLLQLSKPLSTLSIPGQQQQQQPSPPSHHHPQHNNSSGSPAAAAAAAGGDSSSPAANANAMPLKGPAAEGDASIALVGVRSEFPKYADEKAGMHHNKDPRGSSVGYR